MTLQNGNNSLFPVRVGCGEVLSLIMKKTEDIEKYHSEKYFGFLVTEIANDDDPSIHVLPIIQKYDMTKRRYDDKRLYIGKDGIWFGITDCCVDKLWFVCQKFRGISNNVKLHKKATMFNE